MFIGSADWMYRNLSRRIEVVTPILAAPAKQKLWEVLDICLRDRRQAWTLDAEDRYTQLVPDAEGKGPETVGTHETLMRLARERSADQGQASCIASSVAGRRNVLPDRSMRHGLETDHVAG